MTLGQVSVTAGTDQAASGLPFLACRALGCGSGAGPRRMRLLAFAGRSRVAVKIFKCPAPQFGHCPIGRSVHGSTAMAGPGHPGPAVAECPFLASHSLKA